MAVILTRPLFWLTLLLVAAILLAVAWRRGLHWRPAWALRLGLAALVLAALFLPRGDLARGEAEPHQVMVVDQSDSVSESARLLIQQQALAWQQSGENRLIVAFGSEPQAVLQPGEVWPNLDGRATDVGAALAMAGELLGEEVGRVILASDGRSAAPVGVEAGLEELAQQGHQVDVLPLQPRQDLNDGFVGPLMAPASLWEGTPFDALVSVYPPSSGGLAALHLSVNGEVIPVEAESQGGNNYRFRVPAQGQGLATLQVTAQFNSPVADPLQANNSAYAAVQVYAAPKVLFVTSSASSTEGFLQTLVGSNLQVETITPTAVPTDLEILENYQVIFLHNLLSSQLGEEQVKALELFVSRQAGGLVFLGGRSSFTLGGYANTALEAMLPVKLEPPPRAERPPIVFQLVLDRSSSMTVNHSSEEAPRPIELAREAAMRAIETMQPRDYLGVLTFSDELSWDVPIRPLGEGLTLRQALDAVSVVQAHGGTHMYTALQEALAALAGLPEEAPPARHLLALSDGQSFDGSLEEFQALAEQARSLNITISTIAFGEGADEQTMQTLAEAGKGRYYRVTEADELPRILIYESQAARSENVQAGQTALKLGEPDHPILSGMRLSQLPTLNGYNALSSKKEQGAEDVLVSASFGDPILSVWQFGLGRVAAWMGDLGEEWTSPWGAPETAGQFWSQVVRYSLINPALGPAQVNVVVDETRLLVEAALLDGRGEPVDLAELDFSYADVQGQVHNFPIPQASAGVYRLELPRPQEGAYRALVSYQGTAGERIEVAAPFAVNPPDEWLPEDPAVGQANLAAWAKFAGGQVMSAETALLNPTDSPAKTEPARTSTFWKLLLALLLLWPAEIAIRRKRLPWV